MDYTVQSVDKEAGTATVRFHVKNNSDMNSGTHIAPELGGYSPWWDEHIAGPLNTYDNSGRFSENEQNITWTETLDLADPKAPSQSSSSSSSEGSSSLLDNVTSFLGSLFRRQADALAPAGRPAGTCGEKRRGCLPGDPRGGSPAARIDRK